MSNGVVANLRMPIVGEGTQVPIGAGYHGEVLVNTVLGKYYALARAGRVFSITTPIAGVAIPISSTVAPPFGLWNPSGSGRLIVPLCYSNAYVSGTNVQTGIGLGLVKNTGSAVATAAPISAITPITPTNMLLNAGDGSQTQGFTAAITLTTAGSFLMSLGQNTFTGAATVPVSICGPMWWDFDGTLLIPPGNCIYTLGNAASVGLYQQTIVFAELNY